MHFGLGASASAKEIEITWPSGIRQTLRDVSADRIVSIVEPAPEVPDAPATRDAGFAPKHSL